MTMPRLLSFFRGRKLTWLAQFFLLGACVFLLWPGSSVYETDLFIPVDLYKIPAGLTTTGPSLKGIEIRVRGPKALIGTLPNLKLQYLLDLSDVDVGVKSIPINQDRLQLPKGIKIIRIQPSFLTVKIENEIEKQVPVLINIAGKPVSGFHVADVRVKPLSVLLRGPKTILDPIEKSSTKPIDVNGVSESFKKEIALDLLENLTVISPSGIVLAEIFIEEEIVTRKFQGVPVEGKDSAYQHSITPSALNIEVKGPVNILEKLLTGNNLKAYVDLKGLKPGVYVRHAAITLPVKTILVGVAPKTFTVKIDHGLRK